MKWLHAMKAVSLVAIVVCVSMMCRSCMQEEISAHQYREVEEWCANDEELAAWVRLFALSDNKITGQEYNEIWANVGKFTSNKIKAKLLNR